MKKKQKDNYKLLVQLKEKRKIRMLKEGKKSSLLGFGLFGLVGWSVVIPTLIGLGIGIWLDKQYSSKYSWSLMFLIIGVSVGCLQAWYWIQKERKQIEKKKDEDRNGIS